MKRIMLLPLSMLLILIGCASPSTTPADTVSPGSGGLTIAFDFQKQSGHASNQFAVWIGDADGNYIKTLYATRFTANGGYKNRPESIPVWVEKSGLAYMNNIDAVTEATPKSGQLTYSWDLTDQSGSAVPDGSYMFFVEGSLRWRNRILYSGVIEIGGEAVTVTAEAEYFFEAAPGQPALTADSPELGMIVEVTAEYTPPA